MVSVAASPSRRIRTVVPSTSSSEPKVTAGTSSRSASMAGTTPIDPSVEAIPQTTRSCSIFLIATAIQKLDPQPDLVMTGMASTDGTMGVVPTMLAERLGLPAVTFASELTVGDGKVTVRRDNDAASQTIEATLPALVSVTDQINTPRYPSFKGIMAAKKKPLDTWSLADLGIEPSQVGLDAAWTKVESYAARPPRQKGQIVADEGDGGEKLAAFLAERKFV